jgi:chemotaxis protein MotB
MRDIFTNFLKMKKFKISIAILIAAISLTSCVSSKKYHETVSSRQKLEQRYNNLQADYDKLKNENASLTGSLSSSQMALQSKDASLANKDASLAEEQKKLKEMRELVNTERDAIRNLKQEVCSALKCFTPDELSIEIRDGKLYVSISDKLLFPSGSDVVNERGKEAIGMLASVLAHSDLEIMIEGHTDNVPINTARNKDNWDLSAHRATSVTRIFIENGITPQRILATGRGEYHPLADNATAYGRQTNRRTEIVLAPKLDKLWKLTETETISALGK